MEKRQTNIIEAAIRVFTRYGVRRTTMNDIAAEAGIVRQTLYNVYKNKDEVLRAAIRWYADSSLTAANAEMEGVSTLSDQLDIMFRHFVINAYEHMEQTPDAQDMIEGFNEAGREELKCAMDRFRDTFATLLQPHEAGITATGYTVTELADFIAFGAKGIKGQVSSKEQLLTLLDTLKKTVLQAAGA